MSIPTRVVTLVVVLLGGLVYWHQQGFLSATPASRLDLLHALIESGAVEIDSWAQNTPDKAEAGGHYYSDKAPGTAALGLPGFVVMTVMARLAGVDLDSCTGWLATSWAACALSQALPAAFGAVAVFSWLGGLVSRRAALVTVLALTLGSLPLPYSTLLFSHAQVIGLIGIAIWAVRLGAEAEGRGQETAVGVGRGRMALAGSCLGLALASEYTSGLVVVALGLYVVWRRRAGLWPFVLAAIPPLLLIPAYSWATIGNPFELLYSHQANFPPMKAGLYAIKWPDLENLGRLLVGPTRGLVFWTPFLAMAGFGWWWMAREQPRWLWLTYAVPVVHAVVISGRTWDWQAGFTISAHYMAPILPLLALPCAIGTQR